MESTTTNNTELITRTKLKGTPFWIIGNPEEGFNLIMGKWKLTTEFYKSHDEILTWMKTERWNIITSLAICIANDILSNNQNQNQ